MRTAERLIGTILAATLVLAAMLVHATPAVAECTLQANHWPAFDAVASTVKQVVIGRVTSTNKGNETDDSPVFTLEVEEVLRGTAPVVIEVSSLRSGLPLRGGPACRRDATLRAGPGDRIALALGGRLPGIKGRVNTAGWIEGRPDTHINPGLRRMELGEVRRVLGLEPLPAGSAGEAGASDDWREIARSPFGAHLPAYGWTGEELVVVDVRSGRTATYDVATDSWTEHDRAPDRYDPFVAWVWTGSELLVLPDRLVADPAAFDPATDSWRTLSPMPSDIYFDPEHAVWTGEMVVVAAGSPPPAAAYHPVDDTWERLAWLPGGHYVIGLTWTGSNVLAETQLFDGQSIDVAQLEPGSKAWVAGAPGPVKPGVGPGLWMGDALVYLRGDEEVAGPESNAAYYPDRDEWRPVERACDVDTIEGLAAGRLIVDHSGRRALDFDTGECHRYPKPPHRLYGGGARVWTGSEVIYWSGIGSLIDPPDRKGLALRLAYGDTKRFEIGTATYTLAELQAVQAAIEDRLDELEAAGLDIREVGIDVIANRVDVGAYVGLTAVREALAEHGDRVHVFWSEGGFTGPEPVRGTAVKQVDDVKVRLTLDDYPLVAGEPTWITTKVKNVGDTPITYATDSCEITVGVGGELLGESWRPGDPVDVEAIHAADRSEYLDFRWRLLEWSIAGADSIHLGFAAKGVRNAAHWSCADIRITHRIPPGDVVEQRLRWDGQALGRLGPPPEGPARITGSFDFRRLGTKGRQSIEVVLVVPVTKGRDPELLHPMEAVDVALADDAFRTLIESVNLGFRAEEVVLFDDKRDVWVVGACADGSKWKGNWRAAVVDATSGEVVRILDRVTGRYCHEGPWKPGS